MKRRKFEKIKRLIESKGMQHTDSWKQITNMITSKNMER